jgi:phage terminase large subunit GpA-like protein
MTALVEPAKASVHETLERMADTLLPPPEMTIDEWADKYRVLSPEYSAEPGQWSTDRAPYLREIMRACSPQHPCKRVVVCKPSQSGGSEACVLNVIGHTVHLEPRSVLIVMPNLELAAAFSRERLEPMIAAIPEMQKKMVDSALPWRPNVRRKRFVGGFMTFVGANSVAGLSSRPVPLVIMDEVDSCIQNAGRAGNPVQLLSARTSTFALKKEILVSSPSNEAEESGIVSLWESSRRGVLETQCPDAACGHWQALSFDRMDLATATIPCVECGQVFSQHQWTGRGPEFIRWTYDDPENPAQGFRLTALDSPWLDWRHDLIPEYNAAETARERGDDSLLRAFTNTRLALPYRVLGKDIEGDLYHDRREVYDCHTQGAEVPDEVSVITAGVDVQDNALVTEVVGWGRGRESWGIEASVFKGDPRREEVWQRVDDLVINRLFKRADGRLMRVRLTMVDSGGHCTSDVYKFCRTRLPRVFAIKGYGGPGKAIIIGGKAREKHEGTWLIRLGVDTLKDEFHSRLDVLSPGPGFCHWPALPTGEPVCGYTEEYFRQLIAERRVLSFSKKGFVRFEWRKNRSDSNDAFDVRCYVRAALEYLRVRLETMSPDIRNIDAQLIEQVEVGFGRTIRVEKRSARKEYTLRPAQPGPVSSPQTTMIDLATGEKVPYFGVSPPKKSSRFGAAGTSF